MIRNITLLTSVFLLMLVYQAGAQGTPQHKYESGTIANWIPFGVGSGYDGYRMQNLYTPGDFPTLASSPPGYVTGVYFKASAATSSLVMNGFRVDMGNTNATTLTSTWISGLQTGFPAGNYSTPALAVNDWFYIPFSNPVYIDPQQPIVIDVRQTGGSGGISARTGGAPTNSAYSGNVNSIFSSSHTGSASLRSTSGYANHFGFDLFAGYPCTDTPKTSLLGPDKVCPNRPFSIRPDSFYADATYQWEYSANGINWSNYTGVPGFYGDIKDSITSPRWYRVTITCKSNSNLTWRTPAHKVSIAPFYYCYCINTVDDDGPDIGNFTIINSNLLDTVYDKSKLTTGTGVPVYNNTGANRKYTTYQDSLAWPCLYTDTNYIYHLSQIHSGNTFETGVAQGYIDYNRDGLYDPNNERIFLAALDGTGNPIQVIKESHTVPTNAKTGPTGLRIIISEDTIKGGPCGLINGGGEVEDYIVEICHRPCDSPVNAGLIVSTDTSMCAGYDYTLTDTTYEKKRSGFSRTWLVSGDNNTWQHIDNSLNKDTLVRLFNGQPLYYRVRTICARTHDTAYSQSTLVNLKPSYKCYCYSKAVGGLGIDTSDVGGVTIAGHNYNAGGPHLLNGKAVLPRTDFTDITPIELFIDSLYKFELFHTMPVSEHGDAKITVFMDFDNNHEYDIPEERIYTGFTTIGNHTLVDDVIIPENAITDVPTGMRVIVNNDVGPNMPSDEACGPYISGETEDYVLIFRKKWAESVNGVEQKLTGFNVHPNPTNGKFFVQFTTNADISDVMIKVSNVTGQLVHEVADTYEGGMYSKEIDMTGKAPGVYLVELYTSDGQRLIRKLTVR